jgi:hypothetical protein
MKVRQVKLPTSYTCKCGKVNKFPFYIYAHWKTRLIHVCACGRKYDVQFGSAREYKHRGYEFA